MAFPRSGAPPIHAKQDAVHFAIAAAFLAYGVVADSVFAVAWGLVGLVWLAAARSNLGWYSIFDVGRYDRVRTIGVDAPDVDCAVCDNPAIGGQRRDRLVEWVVCGVVIRRDVTASRHYCEDHSSIDIVVPEHDESAGLSPL